MLLKRVLLLETLLHRLQVQALCMVVMTLQCYHTFADDSTSLHVAVHDNNNAALILLLKNKASVNIADNEGRTSLHWAAANPSTENLKVRTKENRRHLSTVIEPYR